MQPTPELIADLFRDRVRRARAMPPEEKLLAGARLFAYACRITKAGIRSQYPDADDQSVQAILSRRLAWQRRREEQDVE